MVESQNPRKSEKFVDDLIDSKMSNNTRLTEQEIDHILKKVAGSNYQMLATKLFNSPAQDIHFNHVEFLVIEFYTQSHIDFLRNIRDIFFYFDLTQTGKIKRVS